MLDWPTTAVNAMARVVLLRNRYKLTIHSRKERLLLAEEAALVAVRGDTIVAEADEVRDMMAVAQPRRQPDRASDDGQG